MENAIQIGNYLLTCKLGEGSYGAVYRAFHKDTRKIVAIKVMSNEAIISNNLETKICNEELFYKKLNHRNIIRYIETLHNNDIHCFVLEYCNAHNLKEFCDYYLLRCKFLPQNLIQHFMKQICEGVCYMHKQKCIHRDLKQENIMVTFQNEEKIANSFIEQSNVLPLQYLTKNVELKEVNITESLMKIEIREREFQNSYEQIKDPKEFERIGLKSLIKIIDLGFARGFEENRPKSFCGNLHSAPPELLHGHSTNNIEFNYKFDIWGIGTIAYKIMTKYPPFDGDQNTLLEFQKKSAFKLPDEIHSSLELIDFIDKLLIFDQQQRMNWTQILEHPFLTEDPKEFNIVYIEIKNSYNPLIVNNKGMTLIDVIDKYRKNEFSGNITLRELIQQRFKHKKKSEVKDIFTDINMNDVMNIQENPKKNKFLSDYVKEDYLDYLYSDSYLFMKKLK